MDTKSEIIDNIFEMVKNYLEMHATPDEIWDTLWLKEWAMERFGLIE